MSLVMEKDHRLSCLKMNGTAAPPYICNCKQDGALNMKRLEERFVVFNALILKK